MGNVRAKSLLLGISLGLLVLYLSKEFSAKRALLIPKTVREESSEMRRSIMNISYVYSFPRCQKNASAGNVEGFSSLPLLIQDFLYHKHCLHFPLLLDVPDKCGGADESAQVFLLLVIKSIPDNFERREVLRKTWAKERLHNGVQIRRIFLLGATGSGFERERQNKLLELEQNEYNDILQWDFRDTFYNLTLKQVLFLEWMDRNCPKARFLLNGDDDVFANTDNMVEYLQGLRDNDGSKHLFIGNLVQYLWTIRSPGSKYYVPVQVYESNLYPPYCGGGGFLLSGYSAMVIYNMSKSIPFIPIDDVYMGMCMAKAGLGPAHHMGIRTTGMYIPSHKLDEFDPCYYKEILLVHRFLPAGIYLMWQRINDPKLKCESGKKSFW
ncbi:N-acetyllactosaminide beta-1,3-N-acetylglucosaminyltransferase 3 isoform X2 [Pleuronectes platessa]|nr:N-acetyllactosaminide beta-1,3-N-acetylglucosaminyltransferase 3 isoform X2 [Pleuronectes platessa]XP_053286003.1 N-acetyllactosaminide beta-1,3-N-acetylglucosaminyltransferase 3 isoform X2 [Pleuronectes platessa]XP_053286004.1 N-acetyllactosaminide beta-1,3-N-acetylglucosaminyltransferase 3 isoform X2 [Pleuronectes platessa]XP_053286005.1 N-acetyllactosaminide beta-1,3-N-acetylglucosaminyltransferase 3 isoform X2 [Pleuronectes platessa]